MSGTTTTLLSSQQPAVISEVLSGLLTRDIKKNCGQPQLSHTVAVFYGISNLGVFQLFYTALYGLPAQGRRRCISRSIDFYPTSFKLKVLHRYFQCLLSSMYIPRMLWGTREMITVYGLEGCSCCVLNYYHTCNNNGLCSNLHHPFLFVYDYPWLQIRYQVVMDCTIHLAHIYSSDFYCGLRQVMSFK